MYEIFTNNLIVGVHPYNLSCKMILQRTDVGISGAPLNLYLIYLKIDNSPFIVTFSDSIRVPSGTLWVVCWLSQDKKGRSEEVKIKLI